MKRENAWFGGCLNCLSAGWFCYKISIKAAPVTGHKIWPDCELWVRRCLHEQRDNALNIQTLR